MPSTLKPLLAILAIGVAVFWLARPIALSFSTENDFRRRRNIWFALTATAFLSPSFWLFALVAVVLLTRGARSDRNPLAFYLLLLHVIPVIEFQIPVVGIESLFSVDIYRLLSLCVLIPALRRLRNSPTAPARERFQSMEQLLLIGYGILQVLLALPDDSPTATLRRAFLFYLDTYIVYSAARQLGTSREMIAEALAAFCLSCALMAAIAAFESARHWLLYSGLGAHWGVNDFLASFYIFRGDSLRAYASSGNTLALAYLLAIGLGFWQYLQSHVPSKRSRIGVALLLCLGLLATYSRGPWLGAILICFAYIALGPRALPRLFKAVAVSVVLVGLIAVSPLGAKVAAILPFMGGSIDSDTIDYRHQLAARAWQLLWEHPFFGDTAVLTHMEDLRQGVGLIDLVNTYAEVALFQGLVGLALFVGFILICLLKAYRAAARMLATDPDLALLGVSLVACIVGTLVMIATCSFILGYQKLFYVLGGLAVAYARLNPPNPPRPVPSSSPAHGVSVLS